MTGWLAGWMNGWVDAVDGRMDRQTDGWLNGWVGGQIGTCRWIYGCNGVQYRRTDRWMRLEWMIRWISRWSNWWMSEFWGRLIGLGDWMECTVACTLEIDECMKGKTAKGTKEWAYCQD